jgi:hypothetical protein
VIPGAVSFSSVAITPELRYSSGCFGSLYHGTRQRMRDTSRLNASPETNGADNPEGGPSFLFLEA